jgi:ubiquinone/menaquinone biosynthesis C-methylase UbiE
MEGNLSRFSGLADDYDKYRPKPPHALKEILTQFLRGQHISAVADIGSGTGLSTRFWADVAGQVIGIEPNDDMRQKAAKVTKEANVHYQKGLSSETGLSDESMDLATCSQSLHWMEPESTLKEIARILRYGGIFAAYDCDWPPTTGVWQADKGYEDLVKKISKLEERSGICQNVQKWDKAMHLQRMRDSGRFRYVKEIVVHHTEEGSADRLVGVLLSQGGVGGLLRSGRTEAELGIEEFRRQSKDWLGTDTRSWYWSYRVRIGIK